MHYLHVCVFFVTEIPRREERMTKVRKCPVGAFLGKCVIHSVLRRAFAWTATQRPG